MKRALLILLVILVMLPLAAFGAVQWFLSGGAMRVRLEQAVLRATGRQLTIAGPIRLDWSLEPSLELHDVALANPPGFSRPTMAHVDLVTARFALKPLLDRRVVVENVRLEQPDILLERGPNGHPNWIFTPQPAPASTSTAAPSAPGLRFTLAVGAIEVQQAKFGWHGEMSQVLAVPHLDYDPNTGLVGGEVTSARQTFALTGTAGPIVGENWPVDLQLIGDGLKATLAGATTAATLTVQTDDLASASVLAGRKLPHLRDVHLAANLSSAGLTGLRLDAGASDLDGLALQQATLTAPSLTAPVEFHASAKTGELPITLAAQAESLAGLLGGKPVKLTVHAATQGVTFDAAGTAAVRGAGDLTLTLHGDDLQMAGALAGIALPPLHDVQITAHLVLAPGTVALHQLQLASPAGDLTGDLVLALGPRPDLRGALTSTHIDLDGLAPAKLPQTPPGAPHAPTAAPPAAPQAASKPAQIIPDTKLPFAALRDWDADLQMTLVEVVWHGRPYRVVQTHAVLQNGKLQLDPLSMGIGNGSVRGQLIADAAPQPPTLAAKIDGAAVPAGPALALFGGPPDATGTLDLHAALHSQGDTVRTLAANLDGTAGIALVDGEIENVWLESLLAGALRAAHIPLEQGGTSKLRCLAVRADAMHGVVRFPALALDTNKLELSGSGSVNLGDEALDLRLRPLLRIGTSLSIPLRLRGTFAGPKLALDPGAISPGRVGITIGGPAPSDICAPALALARNSAAGPQPSAPPEPPPRAMKPADLLRGLLR